LGILIDENIEKMMVIEHNLLREVAEKWNNRAKLDFPAKKKFS